ncbi:hypothetical protein SANTM175S_06434 [Streptomyces antimycoticus]
MSAVSPGAAPMSRCARRASPTSALRGLPLAEYFALPVLPTVIGYHPRLQFVHEKDAIEVLRIGASEPRRSTLNSGTFNIAGDRVLLLSQAARRLGRPTLPLLLPTLRWARTALRSLGITDFSPEQIRLLTHGRVVATNQMRETLDSNPSTPPPVPSRTMRTAVVPACSARDPRPYHRSARRAAALPAPRREERNHHGGRQGHSVR